MVFKKLISEVSLLACRRLRGKAVALLFFLWAPALTAQIAVSAELDSSRLMIGDQVRLQLTVTHSSTVEVEQVDWEVLQSQEAIEVIEKGRLDTIARNGDVILTQDILLTSFDSGYHYLPPIPVSYTDGRTLQTVQTEQLALEVSTFPIQSDTASLAPIKTIIEEPLRFQDLLPFLLLMGVVGLLGLLIWHLLRRRRPEEAPPAPEVVRPPHEVALEQLSELRARKLWQQGAVKEFHSELTHIVREYLENRFQVRALESTTDETMAQLGDAVEPDWQEQLRELLQTADLVKFAKAVPPASFHQEMLQRAESFVSTTRVEEPEEEETQTAEEQES